MRRWLEEVGENCAVCHVKWCQQGRPEHGHQSTQHDFQQCPVIEYEEYMLWKREVQLSDFGCCWRCGLPQMMCDGWAEEECADMDKVMPVLMLVGEDEELQKVVDEEFGGEMTKEVG